MSICTLFMDLLNQKLLFFFFQHTTSIIKSHFSLKKYRSCQHVLCDLLFKKLKCLFHKMRFWNIPILHIRIMFLLRKVKHLTWNVSYLYDMSAVFTDQFLLASFPSNCSWDHRLRIKRKYYLPAMTKSEKSEHNGDSQVQFHSLFVFSTYMDHSEISQRWDIY